MPTKPQSTNKLDTMSSADIVNAVRAEAGNTYQDTIPKAIAPGDALPNGSKASMQDSIMRLREIGASLLEYQPAKETFMNVLVNRIGRVMITSRLYENPWSRFKQGFLEYGETIEEIFVGMANAYQFTPVGTGEEENPFKIFPPNVKAAFHSMNFRKYYPITVTNDDLRTAFLSWEGITDLISKIIEAVYTRANYDEFMVMKYMIARLALQGQIYPIVIPEVDADNARTVTATMVEQGKLLKYMSTKYNRAGVDNYTDLRWLITILTAKVQTLFDVEVLALSFNMSKAELMGRIMEVDGFGELDQVRLAELFADDPYTTYVPLTQDEIQQLNSISGLMVDERWFMIYDNYMDMTSIYNGRQLYWNYFYHVWKTFSTSPFQNAIMFTTTDTTVTALTITPSAPTVIKGSQTVFTATATGSGFAPALVNWSVSGGDSFVSMSSDGILSIKGGTTSTSVTVTATSKFDPSVSATATVTITG